MLNIAIIGAGKHSELHHGPALLALRHLLTRVTVTDLNFTAAKQYMGLFQLDHAYDSVEAMLQAEVPDAVIAVTPEAVTGKIFRQLLPCKLPMLMEKPFGQTLAETRELQQLAVKEKARVMISFNRRFAPVITQIKAYLEGKKVNHIAGLMTRHRRFEPDFVTATSIHMLDTIDFLAGDRQVKDVRSQIHGNDVAAVGRFDDITDFSLVIRPDTGYMSECYRIFGENFMIDSDYFRGFTIYEDNLIVKEFRFGVTETLAEREGAINELAAFIRQIESGATHFSPAPQDAVNAAFFAQTLLNH